MIETAKGSQYSNKGNGEEKWLKGTCHLLGSQQVMCK